MFYAVRNFLLSGMNEIQAPMMYNLKILYAVRTIRCSLSPPFFISACIQYEILRKSYWNLLCGRILSVSPYRNIIKILYPHGNVRCMPSFLFPSLKKKVLTVLRGFQYWQISVVLLAQLYKFTATQYRKDTFETHICYFSIPLSSLFDTINLIWEVVVYHLSPPTSIIATHTFLAFFHLSKFSHVLDATPQGGVVPIQLPLFSCKPIVQ